MRLIAMGGEALAEGFALLGFETYPNATAEQVDEVVTSLIRTQEKALLFLEDGLADCTPCLDRVRREGGRIIITAVPPIDSPESYRPPVEELVERVLGPSALEDKS